MNARTVLYGLLAVVAGSAAVLSFDGLRALAAACGFGALSALLPLVIDAGAAAGTLAWLSRVGRPRVHGRALALVLLALSVAGNGLSHFLVAFDIRPAWWAIVVVGAVAPAVLGAVVHLAVLVGGPAAAVEQLEGLDDDAEPPAWWADASPAGDGRAAELIAAGAGRRRLARELAISEHAARELLAAHRNGAHR